MAGSSRTSRKVLNDEDTYDDRKPMVTIDESIAEADEVSHPSDRAYHRTRVGNGKTIFFTHNVDERKARPRRFKEIYFDIIGDLGGQKIMSQGEHQIARRAAMLSMIAEEIECLVGLGVSMDLDSYMAITDRINRCYNILGLQRRSRVVNGKTSSSATAKTLDGYLQNTKADM